MDAASTKSAVTNGGGDGGGVAPPPAPMPAANAPPPFLVKTYDMVDDPSTNKIVSWGPNNNTFVVWDSAEFSKDLLPKYFKHNNFSSFVRQLNTYGFKKVDPDRWEFANEGFLRGQKYLLKGISRRKPVHGQHPIPNHHQPPSHGQTSAGPCVEVGKFGLEEELEQLKRDKNVLMQELVRLRQQQQTTDGQLQTMVQRLQGMEQRQQQMMSFLAKAVNSPGFLAHFMQQQPADAGTRRITEGNKKRRLKQDDDGDGSYPVGPADGQIVKYQPLMNEAAKSMLRKIMKLDSSSPWLEDGQPEVAAGCCGLTLQEMAPLAEIPEVRSSPATGAQPSASDSLLTDLSQMVAPDGDIVVGSAGDGMPFDIGGLSPEPQMEWDAGNLLDEIPELPGVSDPFWEKFLESPVGLEVELESTVTPAEDVSEGDVMRPLEENGWDKKQHMARLTEQMGLLSSDVEKV